MSITDAKKYPAPRPTRRTLFMRRFLPWQLLRFAVINIRMTLMIIKSHGRHVDAPPANKK